ncbi:hypothetical protein SKTS_13400 [Sulfurimicrobium lacus]|uniref:Uncharacterized protein n=1 Tax=Sulfurimicrobium lacus TaxID=2715678 RepID=A0A6F8V9W8_9PROT|nr:hypothetical protein [Sulfurimicrobium lacus]BCB26454.1 hypothetical protein SKTS_13400 [Sulfurimicrobium lacus]
MDVTRTQIYKDYRKGLNSTELRRLRREIRRQVKEDKARVTEILKPFKGRKLDEETKRDIYQALMKSACTYEQSISVERDPQNTDRINVNIPSDMANVFLKG